MRLGKLLLPFMSAEKRAQRKEIITKYKTRIGNLEGEMMLLDAKLVQLEDDLEAVRSEKDAKADAIIKRMTQLKYEIDIRKGLLRWR